jgi:hypothetical protein
LTRRTNLAQNVCGTTESWGAHPGGSYRQPVTIGETKFASEVTPPVSLPADIYTVRRIAAVEYLSLFPRQGDEPIRRVTETQARSLLALALVDPICRSRRGVIVGLRVRLGVSVAAINAALRQGMGNQLPIAEDNQTVIRRTVRGGAYYEPHHVDAWDDGRSD